MAKNMTQGNIFKCLLQFSIPLILSGLLQQLYGWADAFIVGRVVGEVALGAVGATGMIVNFFIMAITGFTAGLSILSANHYGRNEVEPIKGILSSFSVVLASVSLMVAAVCVWKTDAILIKMNTPAELFDMSRDYLLVIFAGIPCLALYNVYSAVLRGMGDSKAPFWSIVVSAITNVALDIVFVAGFHWGVTGAAIATVAAQFMMVVFIVWYTVRRYPMLSFVPGRGAMDLEMLKAGAKLGVPTAIQYSVTSFGSVILQQFMNGFGRVTVTAITTAYRVDTVIMLPIVNLSSAISTITAQNLGVGNRKRAQKAFAVGIAMEAGIALVLSALMMTCGGWFVSLFGVSTAVSDLGAQFFKTISWFYLAFGLSMGMRGFLDGTGDVVFTGIASMSSLAIRIFLSYLWAPNFGNMVIAYAEACAWCYLVLVCLLRYLWKSRQLEKMKEKSCHPVADS